MWRKLFTSEPEKRVARGLHDAVVAAARQPRLYSEHGVADTVEGRFELVILHAALVTLVLREAKDDAVAGKVSQHLFDIMFDDFDAAMRELGVGDSGVGKKIRFMAEGFYGRAQTLGVALAEDEDATLNEAIARNLLSSDSDDARVAGLADYVRRSHALLVAQGGRTLARGASPHFAEP
ncbi:ubiquinol-cytochrome C chaperone family protein [Maricaulis sp. CAU 1757]